MQNMHTARSTHQSGTPLSNERGGQQMLPTAEYELLVVKTRTRTTMASTSSVETLGSGSAAVDNSVGTKSHVTIADTSASTLRRVNSGERTSVDSSPREGDFSAVQFQWVVATGQTVRETLVTSSSRRGQTAKLRPAEAKGAA